ncbi:kinase [Stenotrophomonas sp. HITSZ_GD]|uniref:kinase n=1 Tax=Stenotrophomonas sp. HITSZ_GD TaxID=3037248 RepID=UPI00240D6BE9|nr:kinase [Stenotrophomonas sp. HITSZ_GD]MDG2525467.1 kinase [Stenotrophomonas sp. HITSZ_GD]
MLADAWAHRPHDGATAVLAISGLQGSGKSTLADAVVEAARVRGHVAATLSLDDLYLTVAQRRALAADIHPLLRTRGPPGTHDLALAAHVLDAVAAGRPLRLPRFDKLADDRLPESAWPRVDAPLDLLVIEGWCVGVPAEADEALAVPLNALEREEDAQATWRRYCNQALGARYPALWNRLHRLWALQAPSFEVVTAWRGQQERALEAATPGRTGMDDAALARFLQHYERVSRQALRTLPERADRVLWLDAARRIARER